MVVTDTKPLEKCCSKCGIIKLEGMFIPKRNICKECRNVRSREKYNSIEINKQDQKCNSCCEIKEMSMFVKNRKICVSCNNLKRRTKYSLDENHRINLIQKATEFKQQKLIERKLKLIQEIGIDNKKCNYCNNIKHKSCFRHNRLKCKECEMNEPIDKFKRCVRSRIISALCNKIKIQLNI